MTVLVTGAAGFIGSQVVTDLLELGCQVIALDDLSGGFRDNVDPRATFIEGSILDTALLESIFAAHPIEYVFHLAAYAAEGLSHFIKRFNYENNVVGSVNLINAAVNHEVKCFVFTSSIAVYGANQLPMSEEMTPQPEDSYGIAKLAVEQELRASRKLFGLNSIIFRPHNVYGEHQNLGDKYRNVVGIFMNQIMQGKALTIFGDGQQTRAFTYIRDLAPVIARSVFLEAAYNDVFNLGGDDVYTIQQLAEAVCQSMGVQPRIEHLPERCEVKHAYASHDKIKRVFGYAPRYQLQEGLTNMARWARSVGPRTTKRFGNIEIWKSMPPAWREMVNGQAAPPGQAIATANTGNSKPNGTVSADEAYYRSRLKPNKKREAAWCELTKYIQKDINPEGRLLELGAGYCHFINKVQAREKHALDRFEEVRRYAAPEVRTHIGSCTRLTACEDNYFDAVFASNLFEHLTRPEFDETLREVQRVLKPDGTLIILQPNFKYAYREYFDDYTHTAVFTETSLADSLAAHGFTIRKVVRRLVPFSVYSSSLPVFKPLLWLYLRSPIRPLAAQMYVVAENAKRRD